MVSKKERTFEENLVRLEKIVSILEEGKISLEESVDLFEEGMTLMKECNSRLDAIDHRINILIQENGKMKEERFDINGVEKEYGL